MPANNRYLWMDEFEGLAWSCNAFIGESLTEKVRDTVVNRANKTIYVRADAWARYGTLADAVDNVRSSGVDQLGLLTEQRSSVSIIARERDGRKKL